MFLHSIDRHTSPDQHGHVFCFFFALSSPPVIIVSYYSDSGIERYICLFKNWWQIAIPNARFTVIGFRIVDDGDNDNNNNNNLF